MCRIVGEDGFQLAFRAIFREIITQAGNEIGGEVALFHDRLQRRQVDGRQIFVAMRQFIGKLCREFVILRFGRNNVAHVLVVKRRIRLVKNMSHRRFRLFVAQRRDTRRQRGYIGNRCLRRIEQRHHVVDEIGRFGQHLHTIAAQRMTRSAHALDQALERGKYLDQQRDIDHADGAMQGVHGAQQRIVDQQFAIACLCKVRTDHGQVLRYFRTQDIQQHGIHRRQRRLGERRLRHNRLFRLHLSIGRKGSNGNGCNGVARYAALHPRAHGMHGMLRDILDEGVVAHRKTIRGFHDGGNRRLGGTGTFQRGLQFGQRIDRMADQRLHTLVGCDAALQHAVEHVFDLPGEFTQKTRADQSA